TDAATGAVIATFASAYPFSCVQIAPTMYGDNASRFDVLRRGPDGWFANAAQMPCLETSVLTFATTYGGVTDAVLPVSVLGSKLLDANDPNGVVGFFYLDAGFFPFTQGYLRLDVSHDGGQPPSTVPTQQQLAAASNGDVLYGIPVIGFL